MNAWWSHNRGCQSFLICGPLTRIWYFLWSPSDVIFYAWLLVVTIKFMMPEATEKKWISLRYLFVLIHIYTRTHKKNKKNTSIQTHRKLKVLGTKLHPVCLCVYTFPEPFPSLSIRTQHRHCITNPSSIPELKRNTTRITVWWRRKISLNLPVFWLI